ncbi:Hypothetical predicted protein [Podarcis lilfordi]|uniref:Uncharacterized protein n=1 Tax=Podarcis lilfordi TaxID=74358 RepID=A0AA35LGC9_9SAUR|nr:Hypothetical predicted protein [Podarcis lilfordi]
MARITWDVSIFIQQFLIGCMGIEKSHGDGGNWHKRTRCGRCGGNISDPPPSSKPSAFPLKCTWVDICGSSNPPGFHIIEVVGEPAKALFSWLQNWK